MSLSHCVEIPNGDYTSLIWKYTCDNCQLEICESEHHTQEDGKHYCTDCSFLLEKVGSDAYLEAIGFHAGEYNACVLDGKIVLYTGKHPNDRTDKDYRANKQYKDWRTSVFERDSYTCRHCLVKGGTLNAHHIKKFSTHKELRYDLDNGLTLCVECHRKVHRKSR